ncbi:MAG: PLD nuclease N-terminal domain-containing protein [Croceibacterium sp.]
MLKLLFGLVVLGLDIWAVLNVWRNTSSDRVKIGWLIGIIIFPIVGFLAWLAVGPKDQKRLPRF